MVYAPCETILVFYPWWSGGVVHRVVHGCQNYPIDMRRSFMDILHRSRIPLCQSVRLFHGGGRGREMEIHCSRCGLEYVTC